jgi:hypothetical protein
MICYHQAMREQMPEEGYLYPEQYRWLIGPQPEPCGIEPCECWPRYTVVAGSPWIWEYPPERYMGFRSAPTPLGGIIRLQHDEHWRDWTRRRKDV